MKAACQSCHYEDLDEKAGIYATALGVEVGSGGGGSDTSGDSPTGDSAAGGDSATAGESSASSAPSGGTALVVENGQDVVDYNRRYEEVALGKTFVNWGNVTLVVLIVLVAAGGGSFVYYNERKLRGQPLFPARTQPAAGIQPAAELPQVPGYSDEVVALLPRIAQLNPVGLHALQRLLENPDEASEMLHSLSRLDPELVKRMPRSGSRIARLAAGAVRRLNGFRLSGRTFLRRKYELA